MAGLTDGLDVRGWEKSMVILKLMGYVTVMMELGTLGSGPGYF